jgi:hypothetical protein
MRVVVLVRLLVLVAVKKVKGAQTRMHRRLATKRRRSSRDKLVSRIAACARRTIGG